MYFMVHFLSNHMNLRFWMMMMEMVLFLLNYHWEMVDMMEMELFNMLLVMNGFVKWFMNRNIMRFMIWNMMMK